MNSSAVQIKNQAQEQDEGMWSATLIAVGSANVKHSLGKLLGQSGASFAEDITAETYKQKKMSEQTSGLQLLWTFSCEINAGLELGLTSSIRNPSNDGAILFEVGGKCSLQPMLYMWVIFQTF
jgi:hypothetical protein